MKVLIEKLPLSANDSFVARTHRTPDFEVPWHQHLELEFILITEGEGLSFIGNYVGEFRRDDVFFLGANLPHTFQKSGDLVTSAVVVHFLDNFWGDGFMALPENQSLRRLMQTARQGLQLYGQSRMLIKPLLLELVHAKELKRLILLLQCLNILIERKEYSVLSTREVSDFNMQSRERLDRIFNFAMTNFRRPVLLQEVAAIASLSVPAFCNYFKKCTKKNFIDFLNEIRIGHASKKLIDTQESIISICYESGFNTVTNFNKQFRKLRNMTPSEFRRTFLKAEAGAISLVNRRIEAVKKVTFFPRETQACL